MKLTAIDPGRKGAIAICVDGDVSVYRLPFKKDKDLDVKAISQIVAGSDRVFLEKPNLGHGANITAQTILLGGYYNGAIKTICELQGISLVEYNASTWLSQFFGHGAKTKNNGIKPSIDYCRQRYSIELLMPGRCTTIHDGITDALCLLEYGIKMMEKNHES